MNEDIKRLLSTDLSMLSPPDLQNWALAAHRAMCDQQVEPIRLRPCPFCGGPPVPIVTMPIGRGATARCTSQEAAEVLRQFGLDGAEEDNHVPNGMVRNFWRPVADRFVGLECACKDQEPAIRQDKGDYVWRGAEGMPND